VAKKRTKAAKDAGPAAGLVDYEAQRSHGVAGLLDENFELGMVAARDHEILGGQVYSAYDQLGRSICLPMPALAPRFLFKTSGLMLTRFYLVDGFQESCKSAFLNEVGRWHRAAGGMYSVVETEQKDGAELRDSFFGYDRSGWKFTKAFTQEDWQRAILWWLDFFRTAMDGGSLPYHEEVSDRRGGTKMVQKKLLDIPADRAPGRVAPCCAAVDSISAVVIEKIMAQVHEEGAPGLSHPIHAKMLADYMRVAPKKLAEYPITLWAVSHLRESQDPKAPNNPHAKLRNTTGGAAPKFQMTTEVEMRRKKAGQNCRQHKQYGELYSIDLHMQIRKNSLGAHEGLDVEMCWYFDPAQIDPVTMQPRQYSYFDWDAASTELVLAFQEGGDAASGLSSRKAKAVYALCELEHDKEGAKVWSKALGVSQKDRLGYSEFGHVLEAKIRSDVEFEIELYSLLGIRRYAMFETGVDFREQIRRNTEKFKAAEVAPTAFPAAEFPAGEPAGAGPPPPGGWPPIA
jgi:hypothetical protein